MYKFLLLISATLILISGCKKNEDVNSPATVSDIAISPVSPLPSTPVTVSATVKDAKGITSVKLYYAVGTGNFVLVNMSASGDVYSGTIPAQVGASLVQYYIEVVNTSSIISYAPTGAPATTATYQVGAPPVITSLSIQPKSPTAIDNVNITALITDLKSITSAKLYYKINNDSYVTVNMSATNNNYTAVVPAQTAGTRVSYYIEAINSESISSFAPETAPNIPATYSINSIFMNEIWSWGLAPDFDWIELYNSADVQVNIGGYKIYDDGGKNDETIKMRIPDGTIVPAKGFYTIIVDDPAVSPNFGLSKKGEELWLENADGVVIDNFVFSATSDAAQSYGRKPDGSGNFYLFGLTTKNTSNNSATTLK